MMKVAAKLAIAHTNGLRLNSTATTATITATIMPAIRMATAPPPARDDAHAGGG